MFSIRRPPRKPPKPAARTPAALALMASEPEYADREFGSTAEFLGVPAAPPPAAPPEPAWRPPPVDWEQELAERDEEAEQPQPERGSVPDNRRPSVMPPRPSAVEEMMAAARERGEIEEPPPLGPPALKFPPLQRPTFPAPDWRAEEAARAQAELEPPDPPGRPTYPAKAKP